jgi:hypothetical protein
MLIWILVVYFYLTQGLSKMGQYMLLPPFQIIRHFGFFRYISLTMYLDIVYKCIAKVIYLEKLKHLTIWNGESTRESNDRALLLPRKKPIATRQTKRFHIKPMKV